MDSLIVNLERRVPIAAVTKFEDTFPDEVRTIKENLGLGNVFTLNWSQRLLVMAYLLLFIYSFIAPPESFEAEIGAPQNRTDVISNQESDKTLSINIAREEGSVAAYRYMTEMPEDVSSVYQELTNMSEGLELHPAVLTYMKMTVGGNDTEYLNSEFSIYYLTEGEVDISNMNIFGQDADIDYAINFDADTAFQIRSLNDPRVTLRITDPNGNITDIRDGDAPQSYFANAGDEMRIRVVANEDATGPPSSDNNSFDKDEQYRNEQNDAPVYFILGSHNIYREAQEFEANAPQIAEMLQDKYPDEFEKLEALISWEAVTETGTFKIYAWPSIKDEDASLAPNLFSDPEINGISGTLEFDGVMVFEKVTGFSQIRHRTDWFDLDDNNSTHIVEVKPGDDLAIRPAASAYNAAADRFDQAHTYESQDGRGESDPNIQGEALAREDDSLSIQISRTGGDVVVYDSTASMPGDVKDIYANLVDSTSSEITEQGSLSYMRMAVGNSQDEPDGSFFEFYFISPGSFSMQNMNTLDGDNSYVVTFDSKAEVSISAPQSDSFTLVVMDTDGEERTITHGDPPVLLSVSKDEEFSLQAINN